MRHAHEAQVGAAEPRAGASEGDRGHADADDLVAERVGAVVAFAHRPQDQTGAGVFQERPDGGDEEEREIHDRIVLEEDGTQERDVGEERHVPVRHPGRADADVALPKERREAEPEEREREPGRHLVRQEHLREQREDHRQGGPPDGGRDKADPRVPGLHRDDEARNRAEDHHPLDTEVQDTRLLDDKLAKRREKDWRRGHHERGEEEDRVDRGEEVHHAASVRPKRTR